MKKICCVAHHHYTVHAHLKRNLETLVISGYSVDIICLKSKEEKFKETLNGVNVYRIPVKHQRRGFIRYLFEYAISFILFSTILTYLYLRKRYDAIEIVNMPDFIVFSAIVPKILSAKVLLFIFDNVPEYFAFKHGLDESHLIIKFWRWIEWASAAFTDHVIVTQKVAKKVLESHNVPGSKISVVLNTPSEGIFYPVERADDIKRKKYFRIMTHGVILYSYGNQTIIRSVPHLLQKIPQIEVSIVGSGEYLNELVKLAHELGVENHVRFTGMIPHSKIPALIADADIGIVPKLVDLMLPTKLMEYVAMGKPVIAAAQPTIKAYFSDDSIMYFKPGDEQDLARCILQLYSQPAEQKSMVSRAFELYERYRWRVTKHDYINIYQRLLV